MRALSLLMALMLFNLPFLTLAQQTTDTAQAIADAQRDAELTDTSIWGLAGCVFSFTGVFIAATATPMVPPEKLIGKSSEYVIYYASTYREAVKSKQRKSATVGCILGTVAVAGVARYLLPLFVNAGDNY